MCRDAASTPLTAACPPRVADEASSAPQADRTWGADCGVGATALWIAFIRHCEGESDAPAFCDPFAARFLEDGKGEAVADGMARVLQQFMFMNEKGTDFHSSLTLRYLVPWLGERYVQQVTGKSSQASLSEQSATAPVRGHDPLAKGVRIRTRFFDDQISRAFATGSGVRQFVSLASGADCRCMRLECLKGSGVRTWLVDQPDVISAFRTAVPEVDDRADVSLLAVRFGEEKWWERLTASGFDPSEPSFFLVEGLVMYLDEAEVAELVHRVASLMAPGSTMAGDYVNRGFLDHPMVQPFQAELRRHNAPWTFGAASSASWAAGLVGAGLAVVEDAPSVELNSLVTRAKFQLIDRVARWVPTYRTYVAVRPRHPAAHVPRVGQRGRSPWKASGLGAAAWIAGVSVAVAVLQVAAAAL